jgi:hypothetical protein
MSIKGLFIHSFFYLSGGRRVRENELIEDNPKTPRLFSSKIKVHRVTGRKDASRPPEELRDYNEFCIKRLKAFNSFRRYKLKMKN